MWQISSDSLKTLSSFLLTMSLSSSSSLESRNCSFSSRNPRNSLHSAMIFCLSVSVCFYNWKREGNLGLLGDGSVTKPGKPEQGTYQQLLALPLTLNFGFFSPFSQTGQVLLRCLLERTRKIFVEMQQNFQILEMQEAITWTHERGLSCPLPGLL